MSTSEAAVSESSPLVHSSRKMARGSFTSSSPTLTCIALEEKDTTDESEND